MKITRLVISCLAAAVLSGSVALGANSVLYWNAQVLNATRLARNPPPLAALHMATYHAAIFDAVDGIDRKWQPWLVEETAPVGASMDAAIASASFTVLNALWGQASNPHNFQVAYEKALADIPESLAKTDGVAWGKHVAEAILAQRAKALAVLAKAPTGPVTSTEPGKWRETPPGFRPAVTPLLGQVTPFVMTSSSQFRAPPPQPLESKDYADELAVVAKVGPRDGAERTEYQTLSTPFWADDLGTDTPAGHWNVVAADLAQRFNLSVPETARLFALLNFATADGGISCWETKFYYNVWRPETALREIDSNVNPNAVKKADFIPNMATPAHPDYTSGHSTFSGAATRVLERFFGKDDIQFTVGSDGLPGAVRTYKSFSEASREVMMSRVWGGIHTMSPNVEGRKCGIQIADWVFEHALQPRP